MHQRNSVSDALFEAYRYLYLSFENTLYDFFPRQKQSEKDWLKAALRQAVAIYSLDLSPYAVGGSDPVDDARASFPFDLTRITLKGKRQGYDDEWIITAKTTGDALAHHNVRSIAFCLLGEPSRLPDVFLILAVGSLTGKTVATDLALPPDCDLEFKIRVVLRSVQQFPGEFASS